MLVPTETDPAARVHERTRLQTAAYERHAYLVYNLALRTACDRGAAAQAAERAFVTVLGRLDPDEEVVRVAVRTALEAAPEQPQLDAAGDPAAARLLRATAGLPPVQRAALALEGLCRLDAAGVAAALALTPEPAETLLRAARAGAATRLGVAPDEVPGAYAEWLWAPPPDELWRRIWPRLHAAPESADPAAAATRVVRAPRRRRRVPRPPRRAVLVLLLLGAAVAGGYAAFAGSPSEDRSGPPAAAPVPAPAADEPAGTPPADPRDPDASVADIGPNPDAGGPVPKAEPLSPEALDKLRTGELKALSQYQKQQADTSLPADERAEARREIARIQRLAERRIAAAERREKALRAELARERAARRQEAAARAREQERDQARERPARPRRQERREEAPAAPPPSDEESGCLFNEDDGSYVCPVE